MNWGRGLFRAWVLGSSLLLGFTIYENGRAAFSPPKLLDENILLEDIAFTEEGTGLWVIKHGEFDAEYEVPKEVMPGTPEWNRMLNVVAASLSLRAETMNLQSLARQKVARDNLTSALLLAGAALALGIAFAWVAKGFRRTS